MLSSSPPGNRPPKKAKRPYWLEVIDEAESFYRRCRLGRTALPILEEDYNSYSHFNNTTELREIANMAVPVLVTGWYLDIGDC